MFDKEFFPTPESIIKIMLSDIPKFRDVSILEPSAGKGDILDYIEEHHTYNNCKMYAIEKDGELRHILHDKGYRVIENDFLEYSGFYLFDYIFMNPPFSNGVDHLLKAWQILDRGTIKCLLNSDTINNPYSEKRKLLADIVAKNGSCQDLGQAFKDAERPTDVNVTLVTLTKYNQDSKFSFDFSSIDTKNNSYTNEEQLNNAVMRNDIADNMLIQYEQLLKYFVLYHKAIKGIKFYKQGILDGRINVAEMLKDCYNDNPQVSYNNFNDLIKQDIWQKLFSRLPIKKYMTHNVRENFHKFSRAQGYMDFNKYHVAELIELLFNNRGEILEAAIVDVFDIFTKYYKENRVHVEGWKTNDYWKVNRKIILPYWVKYGGYTDAQFLKKYGDNFRLDYSHRSQFSDIDKVMCYITGKDFNEVYTIEDALEHTFTRLGKVKTGDKFINTTESQFFKLKFFKKGTLHLEFKDRKLWEQFNLRACKNKNWIPDERAA